MTDSLIGTRLGGCEIIEELGQGGMATVYRAHQISMDRDVAVKVMPAQLTSQPTSLDRFKQEASIVARLEHRAIVPVHDYGEHEGLPYIVMRLMDSGSVEEYLAKGPIPLPRVLEILEQIAPALDYAHREGVLHRDLKPSNILLDINGDAYVTDFGIARLLTSDAKPLTTTGVVGTPSYMSPEQAQGHELDHRSDLYALGVVIFEMCTGVRPFEGETPYSVAVKHVTEPTPSACAINPNLPRAVERVLYQALAKDRNLRHQSAREMADALRIAAETPDGTANADVSSVVSIPLNDTHPTLNQGTPSPPAAQQPVTNYAQPAPPQHPITSGSGMQQRIPPYTRTPSNPSRPAYRRTRIPQDRLPAWLTWATLAMIIAALLLSGAIAGMYVLLNDDNGTSAPAVDYNGTAIFKLTATRQAIDNPNTLDSGPTRTPGPPPTIPPTNTARPPDPTSESGPSFG